MKRTLLSSTFLILFWFQPLAAQKCRSHTFPPSLPGRLGGEYVYTEMGKTKIFFYMTPRKDEITRQLVHSINSNHLKITTDVTTPPCPVSEVSLMITKFPDGAVSPDPDKIQSQESPLWADPIGEEIFERYAKEVIAIAEQNFGIHIEGNSKDLSLIANHDAVKIHKDYFSQQYRYLSQLVPPIQKYYLFQDLTLVDWTMAASSCSGTLMQDRESGDRFLMMLFPNEVFGAIYMEPAVQKGPDHIPTFPGPVAFPFHTALSPIDFFGCCNVGSWKGKRISITTRGVVREAEVENAMQQARFVPLNRPEITLDDRDFETRSYPNGVIVKGIHTLPLMAYEEYQRYEDRENVSLLEENVERYRETGERVKEAFGIEAPLKAAYHLIKHDGGFSELSHILPPRPEKSTVVLINRSQLPAGEKHFVVAEDYTHQNFPWLQFYCLPQSGVMKIPGDALAHFFISPVEEIFFRNEITERLNAERSVLNSKISLAFDVLIFSQS